MTYPAYEIPEHCPECGKRSIRSVRYHAEKDDYVVVTCAGCKHEYRCKPYDPTGKKQQEQFSRKRKQ